jgi:hypothetical protein
MTTTTRTEVVHAEVYAVYYDGKFSSLHVTTTNMEGDGWIKVKDVVIEAEISPTMSREHTLILVKQKRDEIQKMRAVSSAAIAEKEQEIAKLLAISNDTQ